MGTTTEVLTAPESRLAGAEQVRHTPGPWQAIAWEDRYPLEGVHAPKSYFWIKRGGDLGDCSGWMPEADAQLIAAAPDMLAALKECSEELAAEIEARYANTKDHPAMKRRYDRDMDTVVTARAVIAKAEGRTP